jgi:two-component system, cell cycle sensor histidine kinase and response regulator CckA
MPGKPTYGELEKRVEELEGQLILQGRAGREEGRILQKIIDDNPYSIGVYDADGRYVNGNRAFVELFKTPPPPHYSIFEDPVLGEQDRLGIRQRLNRGEVVRIPELLYNPRVVQPDSEGNPVWICCVCFPIPDSEGTLQGIVMMHEDISSRKHVEEDLRAEQDFNRALIEASPAFFVAINPEGKVLMMNRSMLSALGYELGEVLGKEYLSLFVPEEDKAQLKRLFERLGTSPEPTLNENHILTKDGRKLLVEWHGRPSLREDGRLEYLFGLGLDITNRKEAEKALRENELKFRTLFEMSPLAIALTDPEAGRLSEVNDVFCRLTGYGRDEVIGRTVAELEFNSKRDRIRYSKALRESGEFKDFEMGFKTKDGSFLVFLMFSKWIQLEDRACILTTFLDVTERKSLEAQLKIAQKMEAVGTLAGGIAHDFNNLLMAIQGNVSLMLYDMDRSNPHRELLVGVENQIRSGAKLTSQFLGYARRDKQESTAISLNRVVEETSDVFARTRKEIRIRLKLAHNLHATRVDQAQIEQILLNLYINAADAMPGGGDLMIRTANTTHESMEGKLYAPKPGPYVLLEVIDSGIGMDEKTRGRIFDPFFTTKELGRGTGLGLASVYGIVKGHGGYIDVYSHPGHGTAFSIYLPAFQGPVEQEGAPNQKQVIPGKGTILIVDDEERILDVTDKMIRKMGYRVMKAVSGKEAVKLFQKHRQEIDLVILDMVMPVMTGGETLDRLRAIHPGVRILLCSGYSLDGHEAKTLESGCDGFLQKPFTMEDLSTRIGTILQETKKARIE